MKKTLLTLSFLLFAIVGIFSVSASAERYTELPITISGRSSYYDTKLFTLTDFEIDVVPGGNQKYMNTAQVTLNGYFNQGTSLTIRIDCFDASGQFLRTAKFNLSQNNFSEYGTYMEFDIPDVTASVEIGAETPHSWNNTYYYCKYMNVYTEDGRAMGIHDLLLPVYEKSGWYGPVTMYSLDGRSIEVPYCDVELYKKSGWYLWEDYYYQCFKKSYDDYTRYGDYSSAFYEVEDAISYLSGTYYESSLYGYKTNLMDAWRKKINGPLAICSNYVSNGELSVSFRNVSYKTVVALKIQFDCYEVFGDYIDDYYTYYYYTGLNIAPSEQKWLSWDDIPYNTYSTRNMRVTQVVYSDGTSWYR